MPASQGSVRTVERRHGSQPIAARYPLSALLRALLCALLLALVAGCRSLQQNQHPQASFTYTLAAEHAPTTVLLDASASFDPDGEIVTYLWSVGGAHHAGVSVNLPLETAGEQRVRLIVTDDDGAQAAATMFFSLDLAPPALSGPTPDSLELAALVGQTIGGQIQFGNVGGESLSVSVSSSNGWLTASPTAVTVESGQSNSLDVNATCNTAGSHTGTLTLATNDPARAAVPVTVELDCEAPPVPASEYQVAMLFSGGDFTPARQEVFLAAAERWSEVIVGDLADIAITQQHVDLCAQAGSFTSPGVVDDLLVLARIAPIDGAGGVLGRAGTCFRREGTKGLPYMGFMELDVADVVSLENNGRLFGVVLHEIGHILDLNSSGWNRHGLLAHNSTSCSVATDAWFTGSNAATEWVAASGVAPLPVEADGGGGTKCSHWDEVALGSELMTGWASGGMQLSKITVGALHDMGYVVDYSKADAYTPPALGLSEHDADAIELIEILLPEIDPTDLLPDDHSEDHPGSGP